MVAVIALIVFGPRRLPEIARSLGKSFAEFKRQASDIRAEFESGLDVDDADGAPEDEKPAPKPAGDDQQTPAAAHVEDDQQTPAAAPAEEERPA